MSSSLCGSPGKYSCVVISWCALRRHLQVQVGRPPRVPPGRGDELAARAVGGDLVGGGLQGVDLEVPLVVGDHRAAQVPLRDARRELRIQAVGVGVPDLDLGRRQRRTVDTGHLATEQQRGAGLVLPHRQGHLGGPARRIRDVVRALDGALAALAVLVGDLLHDMFHPNVKEQRPFPVLADVDQPRLERVVLVVADLVSPDRLVHGLEHLAGQQVDPLLGGVGDVGEFVGLEPVGGQGA